jgi:hypothetical protein
MSDFFSKLKKGIDKSTKVIGAKSSSAIESNKVKSELNAIKKSKNDTFLLVGKKVYEAVENNAFDLSILNEEIISIRNFDVSIAEKEAELERIRIETDAKLSEINDKAANSGAPTVVEEVQYEEVQEDYVSTEEVDESDDQY